jgi:cephalosporin hydroxylase
MRGRKWMLECLYEELMRGATHWMGVRSLKNPLDAWVYQELLHELRPEVVVELGSAHGGSTLFLCHMLDLLQLEAPVISVDIDRHRFVAEHPRIRLVTGDTRHPQTVAEVEAACDGRRGLVVHDADHAADAVFEDLRNYSRFVAPGGYLVVEDGVRDFLAGLPGPVAAVERFLRETSEFEIDASKERFVFTFNPRGFLRRRA